MLNVRLWLVAVLFSLLHVKIVVSADDENRIESQAHQLVQPYLDKHFTSRFWDFGGNTLVRNDKYVRLTQDLANQKGFLISKVPALPQSFQIEVEFEINGAGRSIYGDGMALWILNERPPVNQEIGSAFGLSDLFKGTAIFFDTYKNNRPGKSFPYVMLMKGDGQVKYDQEHDGLANEIAGCSARGLHNPKRPSKARVTYVKGQFLSLELNYKGQDRGIWTKCFEVPNYDIGDTAFLGFSAQTGELSENHDIYSVHVYALKKKFSSYDEMDYYLNGNQDSSYTKVLQQNKKSSKKGSGGGFLSWIWFLIKLGVLAGVCYLAYTAYRVQQRKKKKDDLFYL